MNLTRSQQLVYDMEKFAGGTISVICGSMLLGGKRSQSELLTAANELFWLNDALRIRICESGGSVSQIIAEYTDQNIEVLHFENKAEMDSYAQKFAQIPLDLHGVLCEIKVIILPNQYGLLVKLHHLISDAWTLALMGNQFNALLRGVTLPVYSYTEYIENEHSYVHSSRYIKDRDYFIDQFRKCDGVTYLSEKQSHSYAATRKSFVIDSVQTKQITDYAAQNETSAFNLFTTALATYMNRTKMNAEKFYIGTVVLNRSGVKEKNTMGMFVNTVPMLIELDNRKSFGENASQIKKTAFSVFRHQKFNYGDILACIRQKYSFSEKLYDVILSYQNATITGDDIETTWYPCGMQTESLQIHIDDRDNEGVFRIHYDYQTDKFSSQEIDRLHQHLMTLLLDAIANDSKMLYELDLLTPDEKQTILYDFNDTAMDYPKDKCVHQLFEKQVERTPHKVAVIACDKTLTYAKLNEQANRIAHSLLRKGVGVGDIVAFALSRKSYLISTIFGILKSGAAYLPIDPDYPQERIAYILKDSNAKLFITESEIDEYLNCSQTGNPSVPMSSDDLCYCIYTSGSTGNPKGTMICHYNLANNISWRVDNYYNIEENNIVSVSSVTTDTFQEELYYSFFTDDVFVFVEDNHNIAHIRSCLGNTYSTIMTTPTFFKSIVEEIGWVFNSVILVGEKLENALAIKITNKGIMLHNEYGPSECTICASCTQIVKDVHIGRPIANTQIYIVDQRMSPVPIGVTGELCIAGDSVGAGYLNRPDLTAEKFVDNPFGGGTLYKTGDLAYWREDGNIVYVGRNDFQVKIRGLRIELGEIENAICGIDGISQAVVVILKNNEGRQLICAFYTGEEMDAREIRNHIGKKLPKYMLPHIFTHMKEMPLTSSGKINRKALPEVDLHAIDNAVEYVAPTTEQEKILVTTIEAVLGTDKVGILDNFFDVGGDSLKAIELISKLEKQGYHTDTKTIFECDTVRDLAQRLTAAERSEEAFDTNS